MSTSTKKDTRRNNSAVAMPGNKISSLGYKKSTKLADTLQGDVFIASSKYRDSLLISGFMREHFGLGGQHTTAGTDTKTLLQTLSSLFEGLNEFVIKRADKNMYERGVGKVDGAQIGVNEDIVYEANLLKLFSLTRAPSEIIKFYDFFQDRNDLLLVMERGGSVSLFEFVVKMHEHIAHGKLSIKEWRKCVRFVFAKMAKVIHWMHNHAHCHLDVSLENIVMARDTYFDEKSGTVKNLDIRFIDFGLSASFDLSCNPQFVSSKYCGKLGYKAPKIYRMEQYQANKADIWSMGVCLFMMTIGAPPYGKPCMSDPMFALIASASLGNYDGVLKLFQKWQRLHYIGKQQYDLMVRCLCVDEDKRISIAEMLKHEWMRSYFKFQVVANPTKNTATTTTAADSKTKILGNKHCLVSSQTFIMDITANSAGLEDVATV
eukprot:CAMPEP_0202727622 /NCGR_PEP_ID=MMETSP1385-20130828/185216_1 /ASSEMBLY_ACC=CAM_ASM_000861 /TAXON_ID=933848 /ORGANISM="Elphidium margaritaceum" /LENGTH=431 /DNA_ID=CAMNT_0049393865 /DNA_START=16 /DNA_END=1311 /DNA_ORIENTATION=+